MKKIKFEDLGQINFLSSLEYNESGTYAAFIKSMANIEENKYDMNLYLIDVKEEKVWQLTSGDNLISFNWLDDENIIYRKKDEGKDKDSTVFRKIYIHGGEGEKYLTIPVSASNLTVLDEDRVIFTTDGNNSLKDLYTFKDEDRKKEKERRKEEEDYVVIEEIPFWSNGGSFNSGDRTRVVIYNRKTQKYKTLTKDNFNASAPVFNEEKSLAIITGNENRGKMELEEKVFLLNLKDEKMKELKSLKKRIQSVKFLDDNTLFLIINDSIAYGLNENAKFYIYKIKEDSLRCIVEDLDITVGSTVNSDMRYGGTRSLRINKEEIYYTETNDSDALLKKMDIKGNVTVLIEDSLSVDGFDVDKDGNILCIIMEKDGLQEIYSLKKDDELKKISSFNEEYLKDHSVSQVKELRIPGENDDIIKGFILEPEGYKKGKKYPGVLVIHGGPKTVYGSVFVHEMQVWANLGYFVFFCNPKGSDGKGNAFSDIRGRYGEIDYKNIMDFTDKVLEEYPDIDRNNLGVTGGSYGGFMTNWIIGHTDRFKCAASQRSISNWISMFGTSDIGYFFADDQTAGWPWTNAEKMWDQSPLKYADKVKTPTLFIHSDSDFRCWTPEAFQMFTALKLHNVESRICLFKGENHELSRSGKPKHRIRRLTEITNWFEKYLKK